MRRALYILARYNPDTGLFTTWDGNVPRHLVGDMHTVYGMDFLYMLYRNTSAYPQTYGIQYMNNSSNGGGVYAIGRGNSSTTNHIPILLPCFLPDRPLSQIYHSNASANSYTSTTPNFTITMSSHMKGLMQINRYTAPAFQAYNTIYNCNLFDLFNIVSMNYGVMVFASTNHPMDNADSPTSSVPVTLQPLQDIRAEHGGVAINGDANIFSYGYGLSGYAGGIFMYQRHKTGPTLSYGVHLKRYSTEQVYELAMVAFPLLASSQPIILEAKYRTQLTFRFIHLESGDTGSLMVDDAMEKTFSTSDSQLSTYSITLEAGQRVQWQSSASSNQSRKLLLWLTDVNLLE
ncbi:MAG: hypothetical protein NZ888_05125 [Candidatus Nitrosocaldus sp.]|nr:hypothetical protein [Candidatus Nitrosocaldus sp.]MDW8000332.1 hypothetical protein [Candidatus Nitrosocaldus sp.]